MLAVHLDLLFTFSIVKDSVVYDVITILNKQNWNTNSS